MSTGGDLEKDFTKTLMPRDDSANRDGSFPCGRTGGFEGKEFRLPNDVVCNNCILSFRQEISATETIHQCADFITTVTMSSEDSMAARKACGGACKNGGHCRNGECICRDGFEG